MSSVECLRCDAAGEDVDVCGWGDGWYGVSYVSADTGEVVEAYLCEDCEADEPWRECCVCGRTTIDWAGKGDGNWDDTVVCRDVACFPGLSAEQRSMFVALLPEWDGELPVADLIRAVCALDVCADAGTAHK